MGKFRLLGSVLIVALFVGGCAGTRSAQDLQPTAQYSALDSTALVYTDPVAQSPINDYLLRWVAFMVHPLGVVLDYGLNRPFYALASISSTMFGYTSEDNMVHSQRPR
ncbi:hypothetical protein MYX04_05125 [Nitrospiraceae bacterium AH_259_D15_M11_P09]|nr:hypothetical protein [Nitrospiraceae bacterium AH_259_D15_M11_P09]